MSHVTWSAEIDAKPESSRGPSMPTPGAPRAETTGRTSATQVRRRPFQVDPGEYPFTDRWFVRNGAAMHYIDEGEGMPVLMLHGNPTWSYLYRNVIKGLVGSARLIAVDYPGFGFSDHPIGYGYTPQEHAERVNALIDHLGLERFVLVMHDWGGPIGMSIAVQRPDQIAGLVVCNTFAWKPGRDMKLFGYLMGGPIGKYLILHHNLFARAIVRMMLTKAAATPTTLRAYTDPFPTAASRTGTWVHPWAIAHSDPWLEATASKLPLLEGIPVELVVGMRDPIFSRERTYGPWLRHFPGSNIDRVTEAGHYLPEDAPDRLAAAVERTLARARA
jgi:haloalkane dehalogenase